MLLSPTPSFLLVVGFLFVQLLVWSDPPPNFVNVFCTVGAHPISQHGTVAVVFLFVLTLVACMAAYAVGQAVFLCFLSTPRAAVRPADCLLLFGLLCFS